jgi:hypothetical protein
LELKLPGEIEGLREKEAQFTEVILMGILSKWDGVSVFMDGRNEADRVGHALKQFRC